MRRGVFAAGANIYCTTKSSGYSETSASFSVTGSAGVAFCVLDLFFGALGIVAILWSGDVGVSLVDTRGWWLIHSAQDDEKINKAEGT
jgi:hypothetical protein